MAKLVVSFILIIALSYVNAGIKPNNDGDDVIYRFVQYDDNNANNDQQQDDMVDYYDNTPYLSVYDHFGGGEKSKSCVLSKSKPFHCNTNLVVLPYFCLFYLFR